MSQRDGSALLLFHPSQPLAGGSGDGPREDGGRGAVWRSVHPRATITACATVDDGEEVCAFWERCDCRWKRLLAQDPATGDLDEHEAGDAMPRAGDGSIVLASDAPSVRDLAQLAASGWICVDTITKLWTLSKKPDGGGVAGIFGPTAAFFLTASARHSCLESANYKENRPPT